MCKYVIKCNFFNKNSSKQKHYSFIVNFFSIFIKWWCSYDLCPILTSYIIFMTFEPSFMISNQSINAHIRICNECHKKSKIAFKIVKFLCWQLFQFKITINLCFRAFMNYNFEIGTPKRERERSSEKDFEMQIVNKFTWDNFQVDNLFSHLSFGQLSYLFEVACIAYLFHVNVCLFAKWQMRAPLIWCDHTRQTSKVKIVCRQK